MNLKLVLVVVSPDNTQSTNKELIGWQDLIQLTPKYTPPILPADNVVLALSKSYG